MRCRQLVFDSIKRLVISLLLALFLNFIVDLIGFSIVYRIFQSEFEALGFWTHLMREGKSQLTSFPYPLILMVGIGFVFQELVLFTVVKRKFFASFFWVIFCVLYLQAFTVFSAFNYSISNDFLYWLFVALIPAGILLGSVVLEKHRCRQNVK